MKARGLWVRSAVAALVVVLTASLVGCYTVPETGRRSLILIPESQELQLGASAFAEAKTQTPLSSNVQHNAQISRVGHRIAAVANRDHYEWEFAVFEAPDTINAWCLPGGKIGFYTGILPVCSNDAGVATVMAHEIGHAVARHGAERMSLGLLVLAGAAATAYATKDQDETNRQMIMAAYGIGTTLFVQLPYSRKHEYEADRIGLMLMADAGYDPREAVYFWQRMHVLGEAKGGKPPEFLSTHPTDTHRIQQLQQYLPEAMQRYHAATGLTPPPDSTTVQPTPHAATSTHSGTTLRSATIIRSGQ
ncbi:MAG: M48 family metallopeptidase [Verrucomicrobia bacterium]|nr:M48 family metallopeptidase [Verrucomicrobiota bacterium]